MKNKTKETIIEIIKSDKSVSPNTLVELLNISNVAVHKHLRELVANKTLKKIGTAPHVFCTIASEENSLEVKVEIGDYRKKLLEENFCYFTPAGVELNGEVGFFTFLKNTSQLKDPIARVDEYIEILRACEIIN